MNSSLISHLLSCLRSMRPLNRRSRRNRSGLFVPEHLEKRELLSVTPVLVADINDTPVSGLDAPEAPLFGDVNGVTVFVEYQSDGSSRLVSTTLNPGDSQILHEFSQRTDLNGTSFTALPGALYFRAVDSLTGDELWKTDGTAAGTERVWSHGLQPGTGPQDITLTPFQRMQVFKVDRVTLFFTVAGSAASGNRTLWTTDGTSSGTRPIDSTAGLEIDYSTLASYGESVAYAADAHNGTGMEPWFTLADGSSRMIGDVRPGEDGSSPRNFHVANNSLFFVADDGVHGSELWSNAQGVALIVKDVNPGQAGSSPQIVASAGQEVYFTADDGVHGRELWWYLFGPDAFFVTDLNPGPTGSDITSAAFTTRIDSFGDLVVLFSGNNGTSGQALWATSSQLEPVQLTFNAPDGGGPVYLTSVGESVYFSAYDQLNGRELWVSDGTPSGTNITGDLAAGGYDSTPRNLQALNDRLFFVAETDLMHPVSNVYTVEAGQPIAVAQYFAGTQGSDPGRFYATGSGVEFRTNETEFWNSGFWFSDGTTIGTQRFLEDFELFYRVAGSNGTSAFFERRLNGSSIFASDGPEDFPFLTFGAPLGFQKMGSLGVFLVQTEDESLTIWTSDGTMSGSHAIRELDSGSLPLSFVASSASGECCFFLTQDLQGVYRLWKTDGTDLGTMSVSLGDIAPDFTYESGLFASDGVAYFSASQPQTGPELWKSDGTLVGTSLVGDTISGTAGVAPGNAVALRGGLVFTGKATNAGGIALWFTDGTADGTTSLTDDLADTVGHEPIDNLLAVGDLVYFTKATDDSGTELWKTDGTVEGTRQLKDLLPGSFSSYPESLTDIDGQLMFTALDSDGVRQIWISDGTTDGTIALTSEVSGVAIHPETDFGLTANGILFTGATPQTGWELYSIPINVPQAPAISLIPGGAAGVSVEWQDVVNAVRYEVFTSSLSDPSFAATQVLTTDREWHVPPDLPVGAYRVWVRSHSVLKEVSAWSAPQDFVVGDDPVIHAISPRSLQDQPTISWTGPDDARSYELWLTNRDAKTRTLYLTGLTATSFVVTEDLDPARYAVWVRSTDSDATLSDWSPLTEFEVLAPPVVLTSGAGEVRDAQPTLVWQAVPGATGYDIRIIPVGSSAPSYLAANVQGTLHRLTHGLPSGQFNVFVRALKGTRPFSAWSVGDLLSVKLPPAGLRRTGTNIAGNTSLAWNAVPLAISYTLEIRNPTTGERVLSDQTVTGISFTPSPPFNAGRYAVRVRSNYAVGQSSNWSPVLAFELFHPPVSITSSSAATVDATPVITWSAAPGAASYEISARQFGSSVASYQRSGISGASHRIETPLTNGINQIWVRGHFADGSRTAWSKAQNLLIGPAPVITRTADGFSWAPVNAATHYEFWLNYLGPDVPMRQIVYDPQVVSTNYTFPDALPKGTFQLWLRAIRAESGLLYAGAWGTSGPVERT